MLKRSRLQSFGRTPRPVSFLCEVLEDRRLASATPVAHPHVATSETPHFVVAHVVKKHHAKHHKGDGTTPPITTTPPPTAPPPVMGPPAPVVPPPPPVTAPPSPVPSPPPTPSPSGQPPIAGTWHSIFDDEFNGSSLNPVWHTAQYWDSTTTVVGQGEQEAYNAKAVSVSNGSLHLTATKDTSFGTPYVSGLVQSGGESNNSSTPKFSFLHGYMEVRAKLPAGQGFWPAIWLMPASYHDGNGEIDVMENLGNDPSTVYLTTHRNGGQQGHSFKSSDFSAGYHTFGIDWEANSLTWYVDGKAVATTTDPALICPEAMYPIMNLAVGGSWPGNPNASTPFPASMDVDYIRIWQQG